MLIKNSTVDVHGFSRQALGLHFSLVVIVQILQGFCLFVCLFLFLFNLFIYYYNFLASFFLLLKYKYCKLFSLAHVPYHLLIL